MTSIQRCTKKLPCWAQACLISACTQVDNLRTISWKLNACHVFFFSINCVHYFTVSIPRIFWSTSNPGQGYHEIKRTLFWKWKKARCVSWFLNKPLEVRLEFWKFVFWLPSKWKWPRSIFLSDLLWISYLIWNMFKLQHPVLRQLIIVTCKILSSIRKYWHYTNEPKQQQKV